MESTIRNQGIPRAVIEAMWQIIDHYSDDEREDYEGRTEANREGHVFHALETVGHWLSISNGRHAE